MKRSGGAWLAASVALMFGCGTPATDLADSRTPAGSPTMVPVDSVVLEERGDDYVAIASGLTVDSATGELIVADAVSKKVIQFAHTGALDTVIGRGGDGPGEFKSPIATLRLPGGGLAVSDMGRDVLVLFDSGHTEVGRVPTAGIPYSLAAGGGDTILMGRMSRQPPYTSVLAVSATTGDQRATVMAPRTYADFSQMRGLHPYFSVTRTPSHLVVGYSGSNILRDSVADTPIISFRIPAVHRRPLPENLTELFSKPITDSATAGMASILTWMFAMPNERLTVVHMDYLLRGRSLEASGWISIVDLQGRRACVDAVLPFHGMGKPQLASRGDTLFVLEQRATTGNDPVALVFKYAIDATGCVWRDLEEVGPEVAITSGSFAATLPTPD